LIAVRVVVTCAPTTGLRFASVTIADQGIS
jgi:hypothetical protein